MRFEEIFLFVGIRLIDFSSRRQLKKLKKFNPSTICRSYGASPSTIRWSYGAGGAGPSTIFHTYPRGIGSAFNRAGIPPQLNKSEEAFNGVNRAGGAGGASIFR